jgi:flavin reductase (DIM6/NTAB) family NADH-FMN oxidoreductase RutF
MSKDSIGAALAKIPSGTSIATATHEGKSTGLLASWIQQVSFEPPMVCMAVKKGRPIEGLLDARRRFVLNVVGEGGQSVFKHFSKGFAPTENAFEGLNVEQGDAGTILTDCIAHLECTVVGKHETGDHYLYVAEVTDGAAQASARPHVHVREIGFSY